MARCEHRSCVPSAPTTVPCRSCPGDIVSWEPRGTAVAAVRRGPTHVRLRAARHDPVGEARHGDPGAAVRGSSALRRRALRRGRRQRPRTSRSAGTDTSACSWRASDRIRPDAARPCPDRDLLGRRHAGRAVHVAPRCSRWSPSDPRMSAPSSRTRSSSSVVAGCEHADALRGGQRSASRSTRVLAWSPDASAALVIGRLGDRRGVFELRAGPEDEPTPARLPRSPRRARPSPPTPTTERRSC